MVFFRKLPDDLGRNVVKRLDVVKVYLVPVSAVFNTNIQLKIQKS